MSETDNKLAAASKALEIIAKIGQSAKEAEDSDTLFGLCEEAAKTAETALKLVAPRKFQFWGNHEAVDGSGDPLDVRMKHLAEMLQLNEDQTSLLVSELRNALLPSFHAVSTPGQVNPDTAAKGLERALALVNALAKRSRR